MYEIGRDSLPEIFKSLAHEISVGFRRLLDWPNRGDGSPRFSIPSGIAIFALIITGISCTGFAQINVETDRDELEVNGECSLREAIINANNGAGGDLSGGDCEAGAAGADLINLPSDTYRLRIDGTGENAAFTGDLDILEDLTINGGDPQPTIQGYRDRIFEVLNSSSLTIDNILLSNGDANAPTPDDDGGAIRADVDTTVVIQNGSVLQDNVADNDGGAIFCTGCMLTITDSMLLENTADANRINDGDGGAIYIDGGGSGVLNITNSTIGGETTRNSDANDAFNGGGIAIGDDVAVNISNSTISGNTAQNNGGGLHELRNSLGTMMIANSTISGNSAINSGGGLYLSSTTQTDATTIKNVTISANTADSDNRDGGNGGGLFHNFGTVVISNSIIAQNFDESPGGPDCTSGSVALGVGNLNSNGNNIIGNNTDCDLQFPAGLPNGNVDFVGTAQNPLDARLEELGANPPGGTATHMLLSDSPAVDAGNDAICADGDINNIDQRSVTRPQQFNSLDVCDIGAVELQRIERLGETEQVAVNMEYQVPINCGIDQKTITNMGNEFTSKEKHETFVKIVHPQTRQLLIFTDRSQAAVAESLTLNNPSNFQVSGVMSPFVLLRINPGKSIQISCEELLNFPIELDGDGNIQSTLLDELEDEDTFFQGTLFLQTRARDLSVMVTNVTQTWTATPPLGGGSPAEFSGGERISETLTIEPVRISGRQPIDFRVMPQGDPTTVGAASAADATRKIHADMTKPEFVTLSSPNRAYVQFRAQGMNTNGLSLEIYSLTGERIFEQSAAGNTLRWHMLNSIGRPVANGIYLYILTSRGPDGQLIRSSVKKILVLR